VMKLDLSDLNSVKQFAESFSKSHDRLDSLILNAGVMDPPYTLSAQGLELQFAVNHLGHFYLTKLLLELLEKSQPSTIVPVSSAAHFRAPDLWTSIETLNNETRYYEDPTNGHYPHSKLCNIYFAQELSSQLRSMGIDQVFVNAAHPGVVLTALPRHWNMPSWAESLLGMIVWHPREAALTQLYTAISPEIFEKKISGKYYHPVAREKVPSQLAQNLNNQKRLWRWSEELITLFEAGKL